MNYKKAYKSANGYTPVCKIGECSLKKLEFGIIELEPNQKLAFYTEDKETAFIMLEGHCNVEVDGEKWENIGNRMTVFENRRAESFYMPREQKLVIEAIDKIKIAVCATPISEKTEPQVIREKDVVLKTYSDKMKSFSGADIKKTIDLAINNSMERLNTEKLATVIITNDDLRSAIATVMDERR